MSKMGPLDMKQMTFNISLEQAKAKEEIENLESKLNVFRRRHGKKYTAETPEPELKAALISYYKREGYKSPKHTMREKKPFIFLPVSFSLES